MSKSFLACAAALLVFILPALGRASIVASVAQGMVQSVSAGAGSGSIIINGKTYGVPAGTPIVGAPQLSGVPIGAHVTAILTPDGKRVMRLIVQPTGAPASPPHPR